MCPSPVVRRPSSVEAAVMCLHVSVSVMRFLGVCVRQLSFDGLNRYIHGAIRGRGMTDNGWRMTEAWKQPNLFSLARYFRRITDDE